MFGRDQLVHGELLTGADPHALGVIPVERRNTEAKWLGIRNPMARDTVASRQRVGL